LSPADRAHAIQLGRQIGDNPDSGYPNGTTVYEGRTVLLKSFPGLTLEVEFFRHGWFRRSLTVYIWGVRPMDWAGTDEYEERHTQ
jgi:hypothetical protein